MADTILITEGQSNKDVLDVGSYVVPFTGSGAIGGGNTRYIQPNGELWNAGEALYYIIPEAGTIVSMYAYAGILAGGADKLDLYVMLNGAQQTMTIELGAAETNDSTTSNQVAVVAGDRITIQGIASATSGSGDISVSIKIRID